jgi:hypothetical protein
LYLATSYAVTTFVTRGEAWHDASSLCNSASASHRPRYGHPIRCSFPPLNLRPAATTRTVIACSFHPIMTVILEMPLQETSTLDGSVVPVALPLNGSSTLPWSAQIARARELFEAGQEHSQAELARTLLRAYNHGYESSSLLEAVVLFRNMHNLALGDALLQTTLDLGSALFAVHRLTGHLEPIEEMVNLHESVAASALHCTGLSSQYAKALLARGAFIGSQTDISEAKKIIDNAWLLDSTPSPDLLVASAMYHHLQIRVSDQYDLEELRQLCNNLITELTRGRNLSVTGLPVRADVLAFTFVICNIICEVTGTLGRAVEVVRLVDSMGECSRSLPDHVQILCSRSLFYITLSIYDASNTTHTAMAREWIERSFHVTEHNAIDRSQVHSALGCWLLIRRICLQKGEADDSKVAAEEYRKALDLCPRGHIYRFRYLVGLTASLSQHFVDTGSIASLNEGATLTDDCLEIAGRIPSLAVNISELLSLRARVGRLSRVAREALLQRAIKLLQTALDGTPETNNARTGLFSLLSRVYALQDSLGFEVDRSEHLAAARRDLAAHVDEAHQKVRAELNVTYALLRVAHEREDADILREGMELLEHVMDELTGSINDDSLSADAASLKVCYHLVYYHLYGTDADLAAAEKLYDPRVGVVSGGHTIRCLARSMNLARFARLAGQPSLEMRAYHHDIDMLPRLAYVGGDVTTRVAALQLVEGLASRAATLALTMNNAPNAIELLEQTRGIEWSQSLQLRVSSDAAPPQHAEVFTQVAASLQTAKDPVKRREYAGEWETIIKRIRQVEGYERFLLPGSYSDLKACASQGAVVIVIPSDGFVDVVTIPSPMANPAHLRLPELKLARFQELTVRLKRTSDSSRDWESLETRGMKKVGVVPARTSEAALEAEYFEALGELWSKLVLPVINSLQISVRLSVASRGSSD